MALPVLTQHLVETKLSAFCERRIPAHARDQLRMSFVIQGDCVTLNEERDAFGRPGTWITTPIAQFRFAPETGFWTLYARNGRGRGAWSAHPTLTPVRDFESLVSFVDTDRSGLFWG